MKRFSLLLGIAIILAACSSDDLKYTPAEPIAPSNYGVYFDGRNSSSFARSAADPNTLEFTLKRLNTNGALTVPIELSVSSGSFTAPSSASFADGEGATTIEVTYEGLEKGKLTATLSIPEEYTNPYKVKDGYFRQAISVFEPVMICDNVTIEHNSFTGIKHDVFGDVVSCITQVPGENHFFWENFLGSGLTLAFKLDLDNGGVFDPKDIRNCEGPVLPLNHYIDDGEYGWSLSPDENATDDSPEMEWTVGGQTISSAYFYYCYQGAAYFSIDFWDDGYGCGWGTIWTAVLDYDGANDQYDNYYFWMQY